MSRRTSSDGEWRTIRISEPAYFKLLELSSRMQLVMLTRKIPLSIVAEWAINTFYDTKGSKIKDYISNPKEHQDFLKEIAPDLQRVYASREKWRASRRALLKVEEKLRKKHDTKSSNASAEEE